MRILVTGGGGLLAKHLLSERLPSQEVYLADRKELDVRVPAEVGGWFDAAAPEVCIHAAAMTTPMQEHELLPLESIRTNIVGTANIAEACYARQVKLVYISTDYVYPGYGRGMWSEGDGLLPVNAYAWSKLGGECIAHMLRGSLIIRCSHSDEPFRHAAAIVDAYKSPIAVKSAARFILRLLKRNAAGVFNVGGERQTIYEFAKRSRSVVARVSRADIDEPIAADSSMDITKLREFLDG